MCHLTLYLLFLFILSISISVSNAVNVTMFNNCSTTLWPTMSQELPDITLDHATGWEWEAAPQTSITIALDPNWKGFIWGRQDCDKNGTCKTGGDCVARPGGTCCDLLKTNIQAATFVYFSSGNQSRGIGDNYYLDLSRGFNLPIQVIASSKNCGVASCATDLSHDCSLISSNTTSDDGRTITCADKYQDICPNASKSNDVHSPSAFSCSSPSYVMNFCPEGELRATIPSSSATVNPTLPTQTETETETGSSTSSMSTGAISGVVVGAVSALVIAMASVLLLCRCRRQKAESSEERPVVPFIGDMKLVEHGLSPLSSSHVVPFTAGMVQQRQAQKTLISQRAIHRFSHVAPVQRPENGEAAAPIDADHQATQTTNIRRLFEDRRFEGELLSFIAQRMDPPREYRHEDDLSEGSAAPPPTYREDHAL